MARDTSPTDRRDYQRPALGDDWADAWDDFVEDSDELAVERGPVANRPSTGEYDDALYLATDQRTLWRWDAGQSDWVAQAGLGSSSNPVPGTSYFDALDVSDLDVGTVSTEQIGNERYYAGGFDGADADARLSNALSAASDGDVIYLESEGYSSFTVDNQITLIGSSAFNDGGIISENETLTINSNRVKLRNFFVEDNSTIDVQGVACQLQNIEIDSLGEIVVNGDECTLSHIHRNGTVTFASGTSNGSIGVVNGTLSVTDNGSNRIL